MGCSTAKAAAAAPPSSHGSSGTAKVVVPAPRIKRDVQEASDVAFKLCPACGIAIEKEGGDDNMMCGCEAHAAGGTYEKALAAGGCGHEFKWSSLQPIACGEPGAPANNRQVLFGGSGRDAMSARGATRSIKPGTKPSETRWSKSLPASKQLDSSFPSSIKPCPACGIYIEKINGDDNMMCGCEARPAGGTYEKALAGGGCGHEFKWSTMEPVAVGKPGAAANDRQINFLTFSTRPVTPGHWSGASISAVDDTLVFVFDELLKSTYVPKCTQDRLCPSGTRPKTPGGCLCVQPYPKHVLPDMPGVRGLPAGFRVQQVIRNEDALMWAKYATKRSEIQDRRRGETMRTFEPPLLTTAVVRTHPELFGQLDVEHNEGWLMHGTPVTSAMEILNNDFNVDFAGSASGTMYGRGVYLCESSTKADEYSRDYPATDLEEMFAMIICRVMLGKYYYTTERDHEAGSKVLKGHFDSTLGDRTKSAGTFREFVTYKDSQVYPEYLVIYHRVHAADEPKHIEARLKAKLKLGWRK